MFSTYHCIYFWKYILFNNNVLIFTVYIYIYYLEYIQKVVHIFYSITSNENTKNISFDLLHFITKISNPLLQYPERYKNDDYIHSICNSLHLRLQISTENK